MSTLFGEIRQNGYVVRDIHAAMKHWIEVMGVGPFTYIPHVEIRDAVYRGEPTDADISIALAFSGRMQIELIEQHNDAPSVYKDFLDAGREGLQHVSSWTDDMDAAIARVTAAGHEVIQQGEVTIGARFAYFDTELHPGTVFEISDLLAPRFGGMIDAMMKLGEGWDGSDPIRTIS